MRKHFKAPKSTRKACRVLAAKRRNKDKPIAAAALRLAKKLKCSWAVKGK